ncbi:uncharacterized protein LOC143435602 isoform X2 [Arvicanthis niloticus]|uniref:uncharacterized protein LOC143309913 isoform X2 n=1 Tax=Arvicanthis niloticus TaxID=61156 RepID=UPI00402BD64E
MWNSQFNTTGPTPLHAIAQQIHMHVLAALAFKFPSCLSSGLGFPQRTVTKDICAPGCFIRGIKKSIMAGRHSRIRHSSWSRKLSAHSSTISNKYREQIGHRLLT